MASLSSNLHERCYKVLLKCDKFKSHDDLLTVFTIKELAPYQYELPEAGDRAARVDKTIKFFLERDDKDGRCLLPLFIRDLYSYIDEEDGLYRTLKDLADEVEREIAISDEFRSTISSQNVRTSTTYDLPFNLKNLVRIIGKLHEIRGMGWIPSASQIRNPIEINRTLEYLLNIEGDDIEILDFGDFELRAQYKNKPTLFTLFHLEPENSRNFMKQILLPVYGWKNYANDEQYFRQTISGTKYTDRGFKICVDNQRLRVYIDFDQEKVRGVHDKWKEQTQAKLFTIGKDEFSPTFPMWSFTLLKSVIESKIKNLISVQTEARMRDDIEEFMYSEAKLLYKVSIDHFLKAIEDGHIFVDFDVRIGHNHGTKFRISQDSLKTLYEEEIELLPPLKGFPTT